MKKGKDTVGSWKHIKSLDDAKHLVDTGVVLTWKDMRAVAKILDEEKSSELVRYVAIRLAERVESRLPEEILIESLLVFMVNISSENVLNAFLDELLDQPNALEACLTLVQLSLTAELSESDHSSDLFAFAVALICELGSAIHHINAGGEGQQSQEVEELLSQISTYLLSISNSNNNCIRLSLVQYFAAIESQDENSKGFNRIFGRFGHTVLEHLFTLLFTKKTEGVALQYLLDNLPAILAADNHAQRIFHESCKYYMLKKPDRFALFIQTAADHLIGITNRRGKAIKETFMQHIALLIKVVSGVNHRSLGRELMCVLASFENTDFRKQLVRQIAGDTNVRESFRGAIKQLLDSDDTNGIIKKFDNFRAGKRGRKPSFSKAPVSRPIYQATYLASQPGSRAS
jgi:hypothetical protein